MVPKRVVLSFALFVFTLSAFAAGPATRANDDSCDIALLPAATLLLPFFEVDFTDSANETTLLSVTNVTAVSRVARVTLWTSFAHLFPQAILATVTSGWLYLNLDDANPENGAHQNWVVVSMRASNDFSGDMDATALGNGCSPAAGLAEESENGTVVIGPAGNGEP